MSKGKVLDFFRRGEEATVRNHFVTTVKNPIITIRGSETTKDPQYDQARERYKARCQRHTGENLCVGVDRGSEEVGAAIHAYEYEVRRLGRSGFIQLENFPNDFSAKALNSIKYHLPGPALAEMSKLTTAQKTCIVLGMMSAAHRVWSGRHSPNFFSYFVDEESIYLPVELFGPHWLERFFDRLQTFRLENFGLGEITLNDVYKNYSDWRRPFLEKYGISDYRSFCTAITEVVRQPCCRDLSPEVREAIRIPEVAEKIARQVYASDPLMFSK